jgi:hypothetical protein
MNKQVISRRESTRRTTGGMRRFAIYTLIGEPNETNFDTFLMFRDELGGDLRRGERMPVVELIHMPGVLEYSSFEVCLGVPEN